MDEEMKPKLNGEEKIAKKTPGDENLENVTADKTGKLSEMGIEGTQKKKSDLETLDRNMVLSEISKLMATPELKKYKNLMAGLKMSDETLISMVCTPKFLNSFEPGQEALAAKEAFAEMSFMGARDAAIKKITSPQYDKIELDENSIVDIPNDIIKKNGMEDTIREVVTNSGANRKALTLTDILYTLNTDMIKAIDISNIPFGESIQKMLLKMEEEIYNNLKIMSRPHTTFPEADAKRLKELYDEAARVVSKTAIRSDITQITDSKELDETRIETRGSVSTEDKDVMQGESTNKVKGLDEKKKIPLDRSLKSVEEYSNNQGKTADGMAKRTVDEVEIDARGKDEKARLAQEEANRIEEEKQTYKDEQGERK